MRSPLLLLLLLLLLAVLPLLAQDPDPQFKWSVAILVSANVLDVASSIGPGVEANPILGRGQFGARQISIKSAVIGGVVLVEALMVRKWPQSAKAFKWVNFVDAGVTTGVAAHNWSER
jgi:hypothetical protein